jgi:hypothetical protein
MLIFVENNGAIFKKNQRNRKNMKKGVDKAMWI